MTILAWLLSNKLLVFFIAATTAFGISTITIAVQKSNLTDELDACREDLVSTTTTTTTTTTTDAPSDPNDEDMSKYRLPSGIVPKSYDLYLYPYLENGTFTGEVTIALNVTEAKTTIVLHNNKLTITKVSIDNKEASFVIDETYELLNIYAANQQTIEAGERLLKINFEGDLTNRIVGFYKSTYVNENSETR